MRLDRSVRALTAHWCLCLVVAMAVSALGATVDPGPAEAAGDVTALVLDGEPGDQVSRGRSIARSGDELERASGDARDSDYRLGGGVRVFYTDVAGASWHALINAPEGMPLVPGTYTDATNGGNVQSGQPQLSVGGDGRYCSLTKGSFVVHEIETSGYDLLSFSASFRQLCDTSTGWLYGEIRYHATGGFKAAEMPSSSLSFGRLDIRERSAVKSVDITSDGMSPLHLGEARLVGDETGSFRIEADSCSGTTLDPGEGCSIGVSAMPLSTGELAARVVIPDDTYRGQKEVALDAVGHRTFTWGSVGTAGRNDTWTGGESLAFTDGTTQRLQQVNVSPRINGTWARDGGPWIGVFHSRLDVTGSRWSTAKRLNQKSMHGIQPAIAAAGDAVYAVWVGTRKYVPYKPAASRTLYFRANLREGASASWRAIKRLTSATGRVDRPAIAADGSNVYVAWTNANDGAIWVATSRDRGTSWSRRKVATTRSRDTSGYYGYPVIAASADRLILAWWPRQDATMKVRLSTDGGRTWSAATTLGYSTWHPAVAAKDGRLVVAWPQERRLYVRTWDDGWGPRREIDTGGKKVYSPAVALRDSDSMAVAYPVCLRNCSFKPDGPTSEASLKWRYSADRGRAWTAAVTLARPSAGRYVNNEPSMVWPDGGRRAVLFDGWVPYKGKFRVYLVRGSSIDPSSAGFAPERVEPAALDDVMPAYDALVRTGRRR